MEPFSIFLTRSSSFYSYQLHGKVTVERNDVANDVARASREVHRKHLASVETGRQTVNQSLN